MRQSSKSFCSWITAIYNSQFGEHSPSVYSTSGGLSAWPSGMSLPDVVLSGPSDVNKARFRGISHRLSVYNRLYRYMIDGWPTSRSTFAARRLFCPLCECPIIVCPPRPVVLCVTQTRVRFTSRVSSIPSDLSGLPPREVCVLIVLSFSLC